MDGVVGVILRCCACIGPTELTVNDARRTRKATFLWDVMGGPPIVRSGLEAVEPYDLVESSSLTYATCSRKRGHKVHGAGVPPSKLGQLGCTAILRCVGIDDIRNSRVVRL